MACYRIKNLLNCPWEGPENIPILIVCSFLPPSLLEILDQNCFIKVGLVSQLNLRLLICGSASIIVANMNSLASKLNCLGIVLVR